MKFIKENDHINWSRLARRFMGEMVALVREANAGNVSVKEIYGDEI